MHETLTEIGQYNTLRVLRLTEFGAYLDGLNEGDVLLPRRFVAPDLNVGDQLRVFVCYDSEDRLMGTTEEPFAQVGEFALLRVVSTTGVGSFFDWGLSKDLFLPFAEQTRTLRVGQDVIIRVYLDKSGRIAASMKLDKFLEKEDALHTVFKNGQVVELLIVEETDLGLKAMVDHKRWGVLYKNETFKPLQYGDRVQGKIKLVRPDGKLDLMLAEAPVGHHVTSNDGSPSSPMALDW
ncbi:MAG: S1 RNA-binding domain-containing protein [Bdellovibrio sp.]|jgi:predicted RNA-binding protein (virulence factor B family)